MSKRVTAVILALLVVLSLSGCFGGDGPGRIKTFNVTGRVTSTATGLGISGATVSINDDYVSVNTDAYGSYEFRGLTSTENSVTISVHKEGYYQSTPEPLYIGSGGNISKNFSLVPISSGGVGPVTIKGWVDYGYSELYGQSVSHTASSHRAWTEPDIFREPDSVIVEFAGDMRAAGVSELIRDVHAEQYEVRDIINRVIVKVPEGESLDDFMAKLRESPMVRSVEPNSIVYAARVPNDPYYVSSQRSWLQAMNLPAAWEKATGSRGVTIAVVDTGIRYGHRDLPSRWELAPGWDFVDRSLEKPEGDDDPFDPGAPPEDENRYKVASHGTHVSGTIGALTNNGIGVAGVNWAVSLMPIRVLDEYGNGYVSDVASGIIWAVDNGADVINLSLGSYVASDTLKSSVQYAYRRGVTVVAASGNEYYSNQIAYPAAYDEVIAVGASYKPESPSTVADFSNGGDGLDLIAPGVGVWSTNYNSRTKVLGYEFADGTSMACPHVAGVVGLMLARNPSLSPSQVRSILRETAIRPGSGQVWDSKQGYGFVNAYAAVTQATLNKVKLMVLDEQLKPVSSIIAPASDRTFTIRNVPQANTLYVFCWLDVDGSGVLDAGDYTGWVEISTLGSTEVRDVSIRLWVHSTWSASAQEFIAKGLKAMGAQ